MPIGFPLFDALLGRSLRSAVLWLVIPPSSLALSAQNQDANPEPTIPAGGDHLTAAKQLASESKWKEAEVEFRTYEQANPDLAEAVTLHAEALIRLSQPFDAALELRDFLNRHPDALRAHELYAVLAAGQLRDPELANDELEICVKLDPNDFQAWKSLGDAYQDQVKTDQAIHAFQQAERLRPNDAVVAVSLARAYGESGDTERAEGQFKRSEALAGRPGQPSIIVASVNYLRGQYLAKHGSGADAIAALTSALRFNPKSADAYYWRARAYERAGDLDLARADALKSLELSPSDKEAALFLIAQYRKAGDTENAQKYVEVLRKILDAEQARQAFGRSLREALDKAEPLLREGKFSEAIPLYESIIAKLPTFYEAYFDLAMCYSQTGRLGDAEAHLRKYLTFQPASPDGHASLGIVLLQEGSAKEAVAELKQAIDLDNGMTEARKALASEYLRESDLDAAVAVLEPAKDEEADLLLANALGKQGKYLLAVQAVDRALAIDPENAQARQLRKALLRAAPGRER
jgi:tetratricopeptide (TPR) repeat protein